MAALKKASPTAWKHGESLNSIGCTIFSKKSAGEISCAAKIPHTLHPFPKLLRRPTHFILRLLKQHQHLHHTVTTANLVKELHSQWPLFLRPDKGSAARGCCPLMEWWWKSRQHKHVRRPQSSEYGYILLVFSFPWRVCWHSVWVCVVYVCLCVDVCISMCVYERERDCESEREKEEEGCITPCVYVWHHIII